MVHTRKVALILACFITGALGLASCPIKSPSTSIPPPPPPPPAPTVTLSAEPSIVEKGKSVTLTWSSENAAELQLQPGVGRVEAKGSTMVTPMDSITYTLTANGPGGEQNATARITITRPSTSRGPASELEPPKKGKKLAKKNGSSPAKNEAFPQFPWPPPQWTSRYPVPDALVMRTNGRQSTLGEAFDRIKQALDQARIAEWSVYAIDSDGFAVVGRLERIQDDGQPEVERWSAGRTRCKRFTLKCYFEALFKASPGRYRVIVLAVTPRPIVAGPAPPTTETMTKLLKGGAGNLPHEMRGQVVPSSKCEALIYEFYRRSAEDTPALVELSSLEPKQHLVGAGLWQKGDLQQ